MHYLQDKTHHNTLSEIAQLMLHRSTRGKTRKQAYLSRLDFILANFSQKDNELKQVASFGKFIEKIQYAMHSC